LKLLLRLDALGEWIVYSVPAPEQGGEFVLEIVGKPICKDPPLTKDIEKSPPGVRRR
jgi:hypothetical protein